MVYLIVDYDYVVAVFANKEKAEEFVARHETLSEYCDFIIQPWEVW